MGHPIQILYKLEESAYVDVGGGGSWTCPAKSQHWNTTFFLRIEWMSMPSVWIVEGAWPFFGPTPRKHWVIEVFPAPPFWRLNSVWSNCLAINILPSPTNITFTVSWTALPPVSNSLSKIPKFERLWLAYSCAADPSLLLLRTSKWFNLVSRWRSCGISCKSLSSKMRDRSFERASKPFTTVKDVMALAL